jgi:hypothetical protein
LDQLKAQPGLSPSRRKIFAAGQNPVKPACIMFRPAKAVSSSRHGLTNQPSASVDGLDGPRFGARRAYRLTLYSSMRIFATMKIQPDVMEAAADKASELLKSLASTVFP